MRAWNYLSSLLSQRDLLEEPILIKSLQLIIDFSEKHSSDNQNQQNEVVYHSKLFQHCFVQGMLQILSA